MQPSDDALGVSRQPRQPWEHIPNFFEPRRWYLTDRDILPSPALPMTRLRLRHKRNTDGGVATPPSWSQYQHLRRTRQRRHSTCQFESAGSCRKISSTSNNNHLPHMAGSVAAPRLSFCRPACLPAPCNMQVLVAWRSAAGSGGCHLRERTMGEPVTCVFARHRGVSSSHATAGG